MFEFIELFKRLKAGMRAACEMVEEFVTHGRRGMELDDKRLEPVAHLEEKTVDADSVKPSKHRRGGRGKSAA